MTEEILRDWQLELIAMGSQSTFTPTDGNTQQSDESDWLEEKQTAEGISLSLTSSDSQQRVGLGVGRFAGGVTTPASSRAHHRQLELQWNCLQDEWIKHTNTPFPKLPATTKKWRTAIDYAPDLLMKLLETFEAPAYVLGSMTDAVLDQWTTVARKDCLVHCLQQLANQINDEEQQQWLLSCCEQNKAQAEEDPGALNLYPTELWSRLKQLKFGNMELLKLCRKKLLQQLTRLILASRIYGLELRQLRIDTDTASPSTTIQYLDELFDALENQPQLEAILQKPDSAGMWTELETMIGSCSKPACPDDGYDGSASPEY